MKDSLFRLLFSEKEELLGLYNAVRGTNYTNVDDLEVNTLENVIYMGMKNDISFVIGGELSLYEHQSTWNGNIPLRNLIYISNLYSGITANQNLYGSAVLLLPRPQFVVFYNGLANVPDRCEQRLSDAYKMPEGEVNLELIVTVLNINKGHNQEFLRIHRAEVKSVSIFEYDAKRHIEMEKEESQVEKGVDLIRKNLKKNRSVDFIADFMEEDTTYVESIAELLSQYPEADNLEILHLFQKGRPVS